MNDRKPVVTDNPWRQLSAYTDARIGLGRAGISLPTREMLAFQLAHARARDAVHQPLDTERLMAELAALESPVLKHGPVYLESQAEDRMTYLQRPDLGRRLSHQSGDRLDELGHSGDAPVDLALVVADGLSSSGVQKNAVPLLSALLNELEADADHWELAPVVVVSQGRVAIGDDIGHRLNARCVVVLIGERPGLSSPDSLGLYLTWGPRPGLTDAGRNCISNIRPAGLTASAASQRLMYLLRESRRQQISGVPLKDRSEDSVIEQGIENFLLR
ncbi:ethanolamine ammonia-lyase subunit EutC [Marinobacter sp.]|uniref:ethanolamine ammonia-lyase subunit EutC n=1 Tax=Marinobacter sp. TaxID=50741 RepID=UPI003A9242CD